MLDYFQYCQTLKDTEQQQIQVPQFDDSTISNVKIYEEFLNHYRSQSFNFDALPESLNDLKEKATAGFERITKNLDTMYNFVSVNVVSNLNFLCFRKM